MYSWRAALSVLKIGHPFELETIVDDKAAPHLCFPSYVIMYICSNVRLYNNIHLLYIIVLLYYKNTKEQLYNYMFMPFYIQIIYI